MILRRILKVKKREVRERRKKISLKKMQVLAAASPKPRPFIPALMKSPAVRVIAEIKRRSPSKGLIRRDFRPEWIARRYQYGGAAALSVLTDQRFFGGSTAIFQRVRRTCRLPMLRKDFLVDAYQVYESRAMGADAVLLIAAALSAQKLRQLSKLAQSLGMAVLFEIHSAAEWNRIKALKPRLVGVNNRDLRTFQVDLAHFERLSRLMPRSAIRVAESGIESPADVGRMKKAGARAILIGEALMRQPDPGRALKKLLR